VRIAKKHNRCFLLILDLGTSLTCNTGLRWFEDGDYAQCCDSSLTSCYAPTACADGTQYYPHTSIGCVENYRVPEWSICNTIFIYENTLDSNPQTDIVCGSKPEKWSLYRAAPQTTPSPSRSSASSTSSPTDPPTPIPIPKPKKKSSSKAWIAGAVVGPLVGLALIGLAVIFLLRRRKQKPTDSTPTAIPGPGPQHPPNAPPQQQTPQQYATDSKPPLSPNPYMNPNPDPYSPPMSPAPQYSAPSPYPMAASSPPQQTYQHVGVPQQQQYVPQPQAAELGGGSTGYAPTQNQHAAELAGESHK